MSEAISIKSGDYKISGRKRVASPSVSLEHRPLIVALHGGGFTSSYFDCGQYSLLDRASAAGCHAIAIDRPGYHDSTPLPLGPKALLRNAEVLQDAIGEVWRSRDVDASGIVLVGHSAGGGIANHLAGLERDWPLLGLAFTGAVASVPSNVPPFWEQIPPDEWIRSPAEANLTLLFGPEGTYAPGVPELCEDIGVPFWGREAIEMFSVFPLELFEIGAKISVPVHCWSDDLRSINGDAHHELALFAKAYPNAVSVETTFVADAGHCIDFHYAGKAVHDQQIAFAIACAGSDATDAAA